MDAASNITWDYITNELFLPPLEIEPGIEMISKLVVAVGNNIKDHIKSKYLSLLPHLTIYFSSKSEWKATTVNWICTANKLYFSKSFIHLFKWW